MHIQACAGQLVGLPKMIGASAQLIIYADGSVEIPADFLWPIGVTDIPSIMPEKGKVTIQPHEPICTAVSYTHLDVYKRQVQPFTSRKQYHRMLA